MTREPILVTGGAGFIGSHVAEALLGDGAEVVVVDDLSSGSEGNLPAGADLERVDITDRAALDAVVDRVRPAAVYHLAAQASVTASVDDPARDAAVNVTGTLHVLEAATRQRCPVVFTSTGGAMYGDHAPRPTPESAPAQPLSPYGASKLAGEAYVGTWSRAHGIPHAICRLANVYGPRQSPHGEAGVVAIFSHRLWAGQPCRLYGHGAATRDYVHVDDVVAALLAARGWDGVANVSTGRATDVRTVYDLLRRASGSDAEPELLPLRAGEMEHSVLDGGRAADVLGWRPAVTVEDGLPRTYAALVERFAASG